MRKRINSIAFSSTLICINSKLRLWKQIFLHLIRGKSHGCQQSHVTQFFASDRAIKQRVPPSICSAYCVGKVSCLIYQHLHCYIDCRVFYPPYILDRIRLIVTEENSTHACFLLGFYISFLWPRVSKRIEGTD